jgi:hypothetical protein
MSPDSVQGDGHPEVVVGTSSDRTGWLMLYMNAGAGSTGQFVYAMEPILLANTTNGIPCVTSFDGDGMERSAFSLTQWPQGVLAPSIATQLFLVYLCTPDIR